MPRKPRFSRKKGKKQGTTPCSIQTNCSDISARTTQLTQASDRTTQITDIVPGEFYFSQYLTHAIYVYFH